MTQQLNVLDNKYLNYQSALSVIEAC